MGELQEWRVNGCAKIGGAAEARGDGRRGARESWVGQWMKGVVEALMFLISVLPLELVTRAGHVTLDFFIRASLEPFVLSPDTAPVLWIP